ncbi:hypothetical protein A6J80_16160 [Paracoccus yeei]|uniref:Uncharacterized protein n=1 Tax=Paracoccus yeei TaxID=147645 RepID=A0A1V0GV13_9RHOB|nr:hypothetical protein [Paracoccus yeei]ARC37697.1 hypothetical protein A6J80_16160 [Paracoccus yeei]
MKRQISRESLSGRVELGDSAAITTTAPGRWSSSRYMMVQVFAQIDKEEIDPILSITTKAA